MQTIYSLIKQKEQNYTSGTPTRIGKYVNRNQYETIQKIIAYKHSIPITGERDALGRKKPFFNIGTAISNLWYKATDIDRKNIRFKATTQKNFVKAFIASLLLREWMRKENFGMVLNEWGRTLSDFGSAVLKFVEKDGKLIPSVVDWNNLICDAVDFDENPKIEKISYTPAQLRSMNLDQDMVEEAIKTLTVRETIDGQPIDNIPDFIEVYEIHGNLPLSYLTDKEEDKDTYRQQMHIVFVHEDQKIKDKNRQLTLYRGKESQDPYLLTHLIPESGLTLSFGAYETAFQAQWQINNSIKQIADQLEFASKMILQTSDQNFAATNLLTDIEVGQVLFTAENKPLIQVNNQSHDTAAITNYLNLWKSLVREQTGMFESITGETLPSGTPFRLGALLNQEASGLFDLMRENKGLYLEEAMRRYVLPYFKKQLNNSEQVAVLLDSEEIAQLDNLSLPARLRAELNNFLQSGEGEPPTEKSVREIMAKENAQFGNMRFLVPSQKPITWKEYFKDLEWDVRVEVTNEEQDKGATIQTLITVLQTIASNPQILQDENAKMVFKKILEEAGELSPIQLIQSKTGAPQQQPVLSEEQSVGVEAPENKLPAIPAI